MTDTAKSQTDAAKATAAGQTPPAKPKAKPKPKPKAKAPKDFDGVVVTGPKAGRWRAGRHFTREPQIIPLDDLSKAELAALKADPKLTVTATEAVAED